MQTDVGKSRQQQGKAEAEFPWEEEQTELTIKVWWNIRENEEQSLSNSYLLMYEKRY